MGHEDELRPAGAGSRGRSLRRRFRRFLSLIRKRDLPGIFQGITGLLAGHGFFYNRMVVLYLRDRRTFRKYGGVTLRRTTGKDLEALARCPWLLPSVCQQRFARGDICVLAEGDGSPVSATWVTFGRYRMEEVDYVFDPGDSGVFLYDAYTRPEWRLKGIHANVMEVLVDLVRDGTVQDLYCAVQHGNDLSLRTHLRFGFAALQYITYVKVLGLKWHRVKTVARRLPADEVRGTRPSSTECT